LFELFILNQSKFEHTDLGRCVEKPVDIAQGGSGFRV